MGKSPARVVYWFRTDLRLHDSPALQAALDLDPECLWPIFTWDPHYVYRTKGSANRWQFLLDCQSDLSASITKLNPRSKLFVLREAPQTLFPRLLRAWSVTHLVFEKDTDAYARDRDAAVVRAAREAGVEVLIRAGGRTLWDSDDLVRAHGGRPTMSITQLQAAGAKLGPVPPPLDAPTSLPDPGPTPLATLEATRDRPDPDPHADIEAPWRAARDGGYDRLAGPEGDFAVETLAGLGLPPATTPHRGGETLALARLDEVMRDRGGDYAATFRKPQTSPAAFEPQSTTLLSPFLHFGALSARLFYHRAQAAVDAYDKKRAKAKADRAGPDDKASGPPESLTGQLLFRDMYFAAQAALGRAMTQTAHNPTVRFVPWHLPSRTAASPDPGDATVPRVVTVPGAYDVDSRRADAWFRRWSAGATGFPWIDALMRQLRHDGWVHHLGRHSLACFLTRGGCYVHWERGADVFAELLLDHEPACNAGNWQWLSCTAFFAQYYRCYSPVSFPRRWDPEGRFVRRWVPELQRLPARYIYEPWKAPLADLKKAGVRLVDIQPAAEAGADAWRDMEPGTYSKPMFDFDERRKVCIASLKKAYEVGLRGDDQRVLDGGFRELFAGGGEGEEMQGLVGDSDDGADADEAGTGGDEGAVKPKGKKRPKGPMDRHVKRQKA